MGNTIRNLGASQADKDARAEAKRLQKLAKDDPKARKQAFAASYEQSKFKAYYDEFDDFVADAQGRATADEMTGWRGNGPDKHKLELDLSDEKTADMADLSVRHYCGNGFPPMNRAIRTDDVDLLQQQMPLIHQTMKWIDDHPDNFWEHPLVKKRMEEKKEDHVVAFRGTMKDGSVFEKLQVGQIYRVATFISTSVDEGVAREWANKQCLIKVLIKQKKTRCALARDVGRQYEEEILIAPYQPIKVVEWDGDFNELTVELLPEAQAPAKAPLSLAKGYDDRMRGFFGTLDEEGDMHPSDKRLAVLRRQQKSLLRDQERLKRDVAEAEANIDAVRRLVRQVKEASAATQAPAAAPAGGPFGYPPMAPHSMMMTMPPYGHPMMAYYPPPMGHPFGFGAGSVAGLAAEQGGGAASMRAEIERHKAENRVLRRMLGHH